jgi:serine/threonine-protein kinase
VSQPERIGKYEVLQTIGQGGFATVYKARDPRLKRIVAIKLCASSDETVNQRFLHEAEIAGALDHPAIVRSFEYGFAEEGVYLVQEYLPGEDLRPKIKARAAIPYNVRVGFLLELAEGFAYAHSKGVLHRDIKPGSVRVLPNGKIRILDFGIAKLTNALTVLSKEGTVLGTAGYLPPEQVLGDEVDGRADVFGFGALAYELLTYQQPFPGDVASDRLWKIMEVTPDPITASWPQCPPALEALVFHCLEKVPDARCPDFPEVLARLAPIYEQLVAEEGVASGPVTFATERSTAPAPWETTSATPSMPIPVLAEMPGPPETPEAPDVPESEEPAPPVAAAPPPPARQATRIPVGWLVASVGLLFLVALVVLFLRLRGGSAPAADEAATAAAADQSAALSADLGTASSLPGSSSGILVVEALPWGELVEVVDGAGQPVELPADRATPLKLLVPPGDYRAEVRRSAADAAPHPCSVTVAPASASVCLVELEPISAADYFTETGWWR